MSCLHQNNAFIILLRYTISALIACTIIGLYHTYPRAATIIGSIQTPTNSWPCALTNDSQFVYVGLDKCFKSLMCYDQNSGLLMWDSVFAFDENGNIIPPTVLYASSDGHILGFSHVTNEVKSFNCVSGIEEASHICNNRIMDVLLLDYAGEEYLAVISVDEVTILSTTLQLASQSTLPPGMPQKSYYDSAISTLFIPVPDMSQSSVVAVRISGVRASILQVDVTSIASCPKVCLDIDDPYTFAVICDGSIKIYDKEPLVLSNEEAALSNIADASYNNGMIVGVSYHDPSIPYDYRSGYFIYHIGTNIMEEYWEDDKYLVQICDTGYNSVSHVLNRGIVSHSEGVGVYSGELWTIDLLNNSIIDRLSLGGYNIINCFNCIENELYVVEPNCSSILIIAL